MNKAFTNSIKGWLLMAALVGSPALAQLENLDGRRLERWRTAFDDAARRAIERREQPAFEFDFGEGESITLPSERPLQRLFRSGWNVMDIAVSGTVMTTPASWFHDIVEPVKHRHARQVIDGWLSTTERKQDRQVPTATSSTNPLHPCAVYLNRAKEYLESEVRDCSYLLYKRERIAGRLQRQQQLFTRVRFATDSSGTFGVSDVFVEYRAPKSHEGRRIVYKSGANNDRMLIRMGNGFAGNLTLKVSPTSRLAKLESRYLITDTGPLSAVRRLQTYVDNTIRIDPRGEVTQVSYYKDSRVAGRPCLAVVITFLEQRDGLEREKAIVFVDSKTYIPVFLAAFDWPDEPGGEPQLGEEFIFTDLQFNLGLMDSQFQLLEE